MKSAACILLCLAFAGCSSTGTAWYNNPDALRDIGETLRAMGAAQRDGVGYIDTRPPFSANDQRQMYLDQQEEARRQEIFRQRQELYQQQLYQQQQEILWRQQQSQPSMRETYGR